MDTKHILKKMLYYMVIYSIIGGNKTWLRVIAMSNCPFWSNDSHAFKCNSECPFSESYDKDENECPFKSLYKDESYGGEVQYTSNR